VRNRILSLISPEQRPFGYAAAALIGLLGTSAHAQQIDYILDTGVGSFNLGPAGFDANVTWLNAFDTVAGGERITQISVSYGDIEDNSGNVGPDGVMLAILNDPDNDYDPANAEVLSVTNATWVDTGFGEFMTYDIEPTVVDGVFFVAVVMDVIEGANPASADPNSPSAGERSWLFYNPEPNLDDLGNSPYILQLSQSPFVSAWMVRATGEPNAVCTVDYNNDGTLDFFDVSAFLNAFLASEPSADLDGNGVFDFFDVSSFLSQYAAGCP